MSTEELIELGRDREAVIEATRGTSMDGVEQLDETIPVLVALVDRISADQLDAPTACAGFSVTGVLEHMIGGAGMFAPAFRGSARPAPEGTVQERFRSAMDDLHDAVHAPGAQERTIDAPFGTVPGAMFARYVAFDGLVHGWDLTTATGQSYAPSDVVVGEADAFARQLLGPELRDGDTFATETEAPAGASRLEQLVAFTGRSVQRKET